MACTIDFRCLDEGFGGKTYKRKRNPEAADDDEDAAMEIDAAAYPPPAKRSAVSSSDNPDKPVFGRPSYDGVIAGKVSGRKWKQPRKQRSSALQVSRKGTTFEEREKNKSVKKAYKERMAELKGEIKRNKEEKRRKREEREKKKKENILKTGTKLQIISNPKTIQRISRTKARNQLKPVPEEMIKRNNKKSGLLLTE
ncbi:coiled-coil domain-containing protein 86 [Rosa chinensis]|nr:coiled-coil domain-containing protein 86 [Rosa chinensis]